MSSAKHKILLGLTGSVATVLARKLIAALQVEFEVDVIITQRADTFLEGGPLYGRQDLAAACNVRVYDDNAEWSFGPADDPVWEWKKGDRVLHIGLKDEYAALVIAPCSANTLAKLAYGMADNLLTSVARAWPWYKPLILAPAMNTDMWEHPATKRALNSFASYSRGNVIVRPQAKALACGTTGMGAMADIDKIVKETVVALTWGTPVPVTYDFVIPVTPHPGAFAAQRNNYTHPGVDLYTVENSPVFAMESGVVVSVEPFTGPKIGTPWWTDTECVMIRGASGVINYGEVRPNRIIEPGFKVRKGIEIGAVVRVVPKGKEHFEIAGWSPSMLHLELYPWNATKPSEAPVNFEEDVLRDPTPFLLKYFPEIRTVTWEPEKKES